MDNCIEITGVETLELHLQLRKYVNRVVTIVIWLVYGAAAVRSCIRSEDLAGAIIAIVVYVPAAFLITRIPLWTAKSGYKQKLKYYGGTMPVGVVTFGDVIQIQDIDSSLTIPYDKLRKVVFLRDCIVLYQGKHQAVGIPNREFTKGSMAELKALLRQKCPDLKIPK